MDGTFVPHYDKIFNNTFCVPYREEYKKDDTEIYTSIRRGVYGITHHKNIITLTPVTIDGCEFVEIHIELYKKVLT